MHDKVKNIAVITGASSGLGREFVKLLADDAGIVEIWSVARGKEKLEMLHKEYGGRIRTFALDMSEKKNIELLADNMMQESVNVKVLVNSAGFAKFGSYSEQNISESLSMIDLNISGVTAMCLACIPMMSKGSMIINIASQASFQPLPYMNIYSATKAFVRNYSRALNVELKEKGISVTAVCPGWMDTAFFERAETGAAKAPNRFVNITAPYKVAEKALSDAKKGKDISVYGTYTKFAHAAAKLLPQKVMMKMWMYQQRIKN
jgi:hypothetical protein